MSAAYQPDVISISLLPTGAKATVHLTKQTAVLSPRNARVRKREEFTMATKRNHQLGIALKLFMVTVVAILGVLFSRPAAAASDKADPLVYVVTQPVDVAGTTAQFGT